MNRIIYTIMWLRHQRPVPYGDKFSVKAGYFTKRKVRNRMIKRYKP